jgi:hypothetical protein
LTPIGKAGSALKALGALVLPVAPGPRTLPGLGPAARWALRAAVLAATLAALGGVNYALELNRLLVPPHRSLGHFWLPLLFLLLYGLCATGWWLWSQLGPGREEDGFPDVEAAWGEAVRALDRAGVDLGEAPLFLVLGRPQGSLDALFDAAEVRFPVRGEPRRDDAPVRVFAAREAIFVACPGASILGRLSLIPPPPDPAGRDAAGVDPEGESGFMTFGAFGLAPVVGPGIATLAQAAGRGPGQYLPEELEMLGRLAVAGQAHAGGEAVRATPADEARDKAEFDLQEARLRHLARLIARDRRPFCPINGILVLIPVAATDNDHQATRVGLLCRRDLAAIREATQVRCPAYVMVCDLEFLPGFRDLIGRLPEDQRRRRMGQRFPLLPDVDAAALPALLEGALRWIAHNQLPARVDSLWRVEGDGEASAAEAVRGNVRLYQLLHQIRERQARLARVLTRAVITDGTPTTMLGGCYLAGTGPDARNERAFIPGVFRRLVETQDLVSWTPELLAREAGYRRWARIGYVALGLLTASCVGLIVYALALAGRASPP